MSLQSNEGKSSHIVINLNPLPLSSPCKAAPPLDLPKCHIEPEPPPPNEECEDLNDSLPSPELKFEDVVDIKKKSNRFVEFLKNSLLFLFRTAGCILFIIVVVIIPISMIIIGSLNMGECPAEPFIPIFLVVYGSVQMLINFLLVLNRLQVTVTGKNLRITLTEEKAPLPWYRRVQIPLLLAFLIVWGFTGGIYIALLHESNITDRSSSRYCSYSLQMFIFWVIKPVSTTMFWLCFCCAIFFTCKAIWQKCHLALTKV